MASSLTMTVSMRPVKCIALVEGEDELDSTTSDASMLIDDDDDGSDDVQSDDDDVEDGNDSVDVETVLASSVT